MTDDYPDALTLSERLQSENDALKHRIDKLHETCIDLQASLNTALQQWDQWRARVERLTVQRDYMVHRARAMGGAGWAGDCLACIEIDQEVEFALPEDGP